MKLQEQISRIQSMMGAIKELSETTDDVVGNKFWFEYHCFESPKSCDAELWYRTHNKVLVLSIVELGCGDTKLERLLEGCPRVYRVVFEDGFEYDVFEDELMESKEEFERPDAPKRNQQEQISRIQSMMEINEKKDKFDRYIINTLKKEGFNPSTDYIKVVQFLKNNFALSGMDAFEMFQLYLNNFKSDIEYGDLNRTVNYSKKIKSTNNSARDLVSSKIPFKGSNTHAEYVGNTYVVYSYNWYPIFVFKDGQWFENENRYSISTAKQMSQLRPNGQGEILYAPKSKLSDIINS